MSHKTVDFFKGLYQEVAGNAYEQNYRALDQGAISTGERHQKVMCTTLGWQDARILDIGCGTGTFFDCLSAIGEVPKYALGVDILEERREPYLSQLAKYGIEGDYINRHPDDSWSMLSVEQDFDIAMCVGITGYWGMHTLQSVTYLYRFMASVAPVGIISFPQYRENWLGEAHLTRFDPQDVLNALGIPVENDVSVIPLDHEFLVVWR